MSDAMSHYYKIQDLTEEGRELLREYTFAEEQERERIREIIKNRYRGMTPEQLKDWINL